MTHSGLEQETSSKSSCFEFSIHGVHHASAGGRRGVTTIACLHAGGVAACGAVHVSVSAFLMPMTDLSASYDTKRMAFWGMTLSELAAQPR